MNINKSVNISGTPASIIFQEPPDCLEENWLGALTGTFGHYRSFLEVAQSFRLAANCLIDNHEKICYGYEIVDSLLYLYRHTLELYMKAIIAADSPSCNFQKKYGHKLNKLYNKVEKLVQNQGHKLPVKAKQIIQEFHEVDERSFAFRYDGCWGEGEYWIGYVDLKNNLNWLFDGFEKIYQLITESRGDY